MDLSILSADTSGRRRSTVIKLLCITRCSIVKWNQIILQKWAVQLSRQMYLRHC